MDGNLFDGGGGLVGRGAELVHGLALLPRRRRDLGGRGHRRHARLLNLADERAEVLDHLLHGFLQLAQLSTTGELHVGSQIAAGEFLGHRTTSMTGRDRFLATNTATNATTST